MGRAEIHWPDATFFAAFVIGAVAFFWTISPFIVPLLLAGAAVALVGGLHERLAKSLGDRRRLSALLASIAILVVVLVPTAVVVWLVLRQSFEVLGRWQEAIAEGGIDALLTGRFRDQLAPMLRQLDELGFTTYLRDALERAATFLSTHLAATALIVARLVLQAVILVIGMYYFFLDGPRIVDELEAHGPMEASHVHEIISDTSAILRAIFLASFVTAVIQGILGVLGFWIGGLPNAVLWAAVMAFLALIFSLLPLVGSGLVFIPAAIWLIANGKVLGGIFVLLWGLLVIGMVEYFVKPYFAKERLEIYPVVFFLTLFGGIEVMGPIGALAGPVLAAVVGSFLRVWKRDILPELVPHGFAKET
ncbi:MAG TPA: AI-2E family transporter [Vulgatibacter sp.]|nr:AI-2E family transporter [Vulgatibacter sp.]